MAASVTVHHKAFSDPRMQFLAKLLGVTVDDASFKMVRLWSLMTELHTDAPPAEHIRAVLLDENGDQILVRCGLGERLEDGSVRVRGRVDDTTGKDRLEWYADMQETKQRAGKARAARGQRNVRGHLLPASAGPSAGPSAGGDRSDDYQIAGISPAPDPISDPDPRSEEREQSAREQQAEHEGTEENAIPLPQSPPLRVVRSPERSLERELQETDRLFREPRALVAETRRKLADLRMAIAKELGMHDVRPIRLGQGRGEYQLAARIRDAGTIEQASADIAHVFAVIAAEARSKRSVEWLTESVYEETSWRRQLGMRIADVRGSAARTGDEAPRRVMPAWGDHTAPDWSPES